MFHMINVRKMMSKKADGMSINIVVVAVLALVVLVVLLAIFSNKMKTGVKGQEDAQKTLQSNVCAETVDKTTYYCSTTSSCNVGNKAKEADYIDCPKGSGYCCVKTT